MVAIWISGVMIGFALGVYTARRVLEPPAGEDPCARCGRHKPGSYRGI